MQEAIAAAILLIGSCFMGGCAALQEGAQEVNKGAKELEQEYAKAKKKYKQIRPRIKRDLTLLFGTDSSGNIDTEAVKLDNYPEDGKPGLQDLVYDRFGSFDEDELKRLKEANEEAKRLYRQMKEIDRKLQNRSGDLEEVLKQIKNLTSKDGLTSEGTLSALTEFAKVAGNVYIQSQN